ncbi:MAG TPA: hypothetical protein VJ765_09105, partial [Chitinophagaceae bacterium]|nr:hypothetical protein [Chitinophagaceae bacterium]
MKKIFTMCLGLVLTAAVFAADRRPDVTVISPKRYEIVIDGKTYFSGNQKMNIENLRKGRHSIKVYETTSGFSFFKKKRLVASKVFQLRNDDLRITIDRFGHMTITEDKFGRRDNKFGKEGRGWDDNR